MQTVILFIVYSYSIPDLKLLLLLDYEIIIYFLILFSLHESVP